MSSIAGTLLQSSPQLPSTQLDTRLPSCHCLCTPLASYRPLQFIVVLIIDVELVYTMSSNVPKHTVEDDVHTLRKQMAALVSSLRE